MKKACILLLTLFGLATSVCLGQSAPTNQPDSPHIKPPTVTSTPKPGAASVNSLEQTLIAREKEVWAALKKKDTERFASYLAEDQVYVTDDGAHSKAEAVKLLGEAPAGPDVTLDDWKVLMLDKDAAIVTYRATVVPPACGPTTAAAVMRNSTVWVKRGGKWLAVFHQDTTMASGK